MRSLLAAVVVLAAAGPAAAHRLNVEAKLVGDQLRVEAYYDDDTPAPDAKVAVRLGDQTVATGRTDDRGVWTRPRPAPGTYTVRVESVGHAATETLVVPAPAAVPAVAAAPPTDEREQRTRTPWGRLAAGVGVIGGLGVVWLVARRSRRSGVSGAATDQEPRRGDRW